LIFVQEERDPLSASTTRRYPPNINCWRSCLFSNICFWHLCGKSDIYSAVALFLSFLFCSTGLFLCQCHATYVTMALLYNLKSDIVRHLEMLHFLRIALVIWGLLCFHMDFRIDFLFLRQMALEFWWRLEFWIYRVLSVILQY
jgi:hypothetical protein